MCQHTLGGEATGLPCTRTDPHSVGHVYVSTSASDDRHGEGGHG